MSNSHAWAWNSHGTVWIDTRLTPRHGVWMKLREGATEIESWFVEFLSPNMHPKEHLQLDAVTFTSVSRQILLTLLCFISKKNIMTNLTPSIRVMGCEGNRSAWESEPPLHGTCENVLLLAVYVKSYRKYYTHYNPQSFQTQKNTACNRTEHPKNLYTIIKWSYFQDQFKFSLEPKGNQPFFDFGCAQVASCCLPNRWSLARYLVDQMRSKQLLPDLMLGRMGRDAGESQMECKRMLPLEVGL